MKEKATKYFKEGYSCSEAILKAAIDEELISEHILPVATAFSGGMSSGCLCGAVAACQIIIGATNGRTDIAQPPDTAKALAKEFLTQFKEKRGSSCCRVLTAKHNFSSPERKLHCTQIVNDATELLEQLLRGTKSEPLKNLVKH